MSLVFSFGEVIFTESLLMSVFRKETVTQQQSCYPGNHTASDNDVLRICVTTADLSRLINPIFYVLTPTFKIVKEADVGD
jgi:hypothetical protein